MIKSNNILAHGTRLCPQLLRLNVKITQKSSFHILKKEIKIHNYFNARGFLSFAKNSNFISILGWIDNKNSVRFFFIAFAFFYKYVLKPNNHLKITAMLRKQLLLYQYTCPSKDRNANQ